MPSHYSIDEKRGLVLVEIEGVLTGEGLASLDEQVRNDAAFNPDHDQLLDLSEADPSGLNRSDFAVIARRPPAFSPTSRRAFVIPAGDLAFGLTRMFEMMRESPENQIEIFTDIGEARGWLGLE